LIKQLFLTGHQVCYFNAEASSMVKPGHFWKVLWSID